MEVRELFGRKLRYLRKERGWTQEALAEQADLTAKYIGQLERCEVCPSLAVLDRLARGLDLPLHELVRLPAPGAKSREVLHGELSNEEVKAVRTAVDILHRVFDE